MKRSRKQSARLGISVGEKAMWIAQNDGASRQATFVYPPGAGLDQPAALGSMLAAFLAKQGFKSREVVAGLPARWVLVRSRKIPRSDPETMLAMLRIEVERDRTGDGKEWLSDFADQRPDDAAAPILLVSAARSHVSAVEATLRAAGLDIAGITATSLALGRGLAKTNSTAGSLLLTPEGAELAIVTDGSVESVAPMSANFSGGLSATAVAQELRRTLTMRRGGQVGAVTTLSVTDVIGVNDTWLRELTERSALGVERCNGGPAEALADAPTDAGFADLLHSKLAERRAGVVTRGRAWAGAVILALLVAAGVFAWDWVSESRAVDDLTTQLDELSAPVTAARENVDRVRLARGWQDTRPPMLACSRAISQAFPDDGAWVTSLSVREDMNGTMAGKAQGEKVVLDLLDRMKASGGFADVKLSYLREADRRTHTVAFAVSFKFVGKE